MLIIADWFVYTYAESTRKLKQLRKAWAVQHRSKNFTVERYRFYIV